MGRRRMLDVFDCRALNTQYRWPIMSVHCGGGASYVGWCKSWRDWRVHRVNTCHRSLVIRSVNTFEHIKSPDHNSP